MSLISGSDGVSSAIDKPVAMLRAGEDVGAPSKEQADPGFAKRSAAARA